MRRALWQAVMVVGCLTGGSISEIQMEREHHWYYYKPKISEYVNDTDYTGDGTSSGQGTNNGHLILILQKIKIDTDYTPDWRLEEEPLAPYGDRYYEHERPYSISPAFKQSALWEANTKGYFSSSPDKPDTLNCYCATVFKRYTLLGTGAVITTRHILTTASSTELILRRYGHRKHLTNLLGAWYDVDADSYNSSMYMTPSRIHYHPKFIMPENVNISHPLPIYQDLAIWAATYPFQGRFWYGPRAYICQRAGSFWMQRLSPVPGVANELHEAILVGYQFMVWYKKKPMPWFKYAMKTKAFLKNCPKAEWGWFFCLKGRFAMKGIDSGMMMHRNTRAQGLLYDGLWAVGAFSMTLRADKLVHYFTPIENHDALEFMYNAYMGLLPYRYLDDRFEDSRDKAPVPKSGHHIEWEYPVGEEIITEKSWYQRIWLVGQYLG